MIEKADIITYSVIFNIRVGEALIFGTMMIGQSLAFAPNYNKAKISGARILALLDRRPKIENSPGVGLQIVQTLSKPCFRAWN